MTASQGWSLLAFLGALSLSQHVQAQAAEEAYFMDEAETMVPSGSVESDGDADGRLGSVRMRRANRVASSLLRQRMASSRPSDLQLLSQAREAEIIVAAGDHDRVQDVLAAIGLNHVVVPLHLVPRLPLMTTQTLVLNCDGHVDPAAVAKVRQFVEAGGYVVSTDWSLNLVAQAFPQTVARGSQHTRDDVVRVSTSRANHPLLQHVHSTRDELRWWLEGQSYPIRILDRRRVEVLLSSRQMRARYGHAPVVVSFGAGEGRVLHTTSHFYLQQSQLEGTRAASAASAFARDLGVGGAALDELRRQGLDEVAVGEVAGAYAMQQLLSNLIVDKRRRNEELLRNYRLQATVESGLSERPRGNGRLTGEIGPGFLLRELERRGDWLRVQDLFGRSGWIPSAAARTR